MRKAIKTKGKIAKAYELGASSDMERALIESGRIRIREDGRYELFSLEAVNGSGEIAQAGDFFKVDDSGSPYPIKRSDFMDNHRRIEGDLYEQMPRPLEAWTAEDGMCAEIEYLIANKGLVLDETSADKYFNAPLYGTLESAARDAVLIFYRLTRDGEGRVADATFNFVERSYFDRNYEWIE